MSVNEKMTNIANAIRHKTGGTDLLNLDQMAAEVEGLRVEKYDHRVRFFLNAKAGDTVSFWMGQPEHGVAVNWGDGSGSMTYAGNRYSAKNLEAPDGVETDDHSYAADGEYVLTLDPLNGAALSLGGEFYFVQNPGMNGMKTYSACVYHSGKGIYKIVLGACAPVIGTGAFMNLESVEIYDFSAYTAVPALPDGNTFSGIAEGCEIHVPAALYNEWVAAAYWADLAAHIKAV